MKFEIWSVLVVRSVKPHEFKMLYELFIRLFTPLFSFLIKHGCILIPRKQTKMSVKNDYRYLMVIMTNLSEGKESKVYEIM